jgi:fibro-slime domain-containing protein
MAMTQRIDLDRLSWLTENRTHRLRIFFANRLGHRSNLRIETSMTLLKVAAMPRSPQED